MKFVLILSLSLAALVPKACQTPTTPAPKVVVAPTGEKTETELAALREQTQSQQTQIQKQQELAQRAAGSVFGASEANSHNPPGLPQQATQLQLDEAASALPAPTTEQKLEKERQNAAVLRGELDAVRAEMGIAKSQNEQLKADLTSATQRASLAEQKAAEVAAAALKERSDAAAALQRQFDAMSRQIKDEQAKVQAARDEQRKSMLAKLGHVLLGLGALFTLAGAFQGYATVQAGELTPRGFLKPLVWAGAAAFCFACYWTINQPWFIWVVIGGGSLGLIGGASFAWSEWQEAKQRRAGKQRAGEADEAEETLKIVMAEMDGANTVSDLKERLSKRMSDNHKALVHELRAEDKRS